MSDLDHRVGVKEANLVVRHLKLEGLSETNRAPLLQAIDNTFGIDSVSYDEATQTLHLAYDATHCTLDGIEALIRQHQADIAHEWWTRFKEGYYQFVDENVRDNAKRQPWNCHHRQNKK